MTDSGVSEADFWQQVKRNLPQDVHASRIENTVGSGISDVNVARKGFGELWLELKVTHGKNVHFRNSQRSWIAARTDAGGRVLVVLRDGKEVITYDARTVVLACPYTAIKDKKSFYVKLEDMRGMLFRDTQPVSWDRFWTAAFGTQGA